MTFTRKAASEMRERVIGALRDARDDVPVDAIIGARPARLAKACSSHGEALGWSLLAHPAALAIFTIDALSGTLARQAPITSRLGAAPRVIERAEALYAEAARAALAEADPPTTSWRRLLAHLDNDAQQVVALLADMLAKREQWLPHVVGKDGDKLRAQIESVLRAEIDAELAAVHAAFDPLTSTALARCAGQPPSTCAPTTRSRSSRGRSSGALRGSGLPAPHHEDLRHGGKWPTGCSSASKPVARKTMTAQRGVPSAEVDRGRLKAEVTRDARGARRNGRTCRRAARARNLPAARFADADWAIVAALLHVLPQAAAQLTMVFAAHGAVDFAQLTLAALEALGDAGRAAATCCCGSTLRSSICWSTSSRTRPSRSSGSSSC